MEISNTVELFKLGQNCVSYTGCSTRNASCLSNYDLKLFNYGHKGCYSNKCS